MKTQLKKSMNFALASALVVSSLGFNSAHAQMIAMADIEPTYSTSDDLKVIPYRAFGPLFYEKNLNYPVSAPWFSYEHLTRHRIALKPSAAANSGADESGWVPVPVKDGSVYFRAEYHLKDLADVSMDEYISSTMATYAELKRTGRRRSDWRPNAEQQNEFKSKSKMQIVVYPTEQFQAQFFPGTTILTHELGSMTKGSISGTRGNIKLKSSYSRVPKEYGQVAGVFKGTFDNVDCIRGGRLPGLIVDGQVIDAPLDELATIAVYTDGTMKIAPYSKLPKAGIQMLRQNEYPILEDGQLTTSGSYPAGWNRFEDDIMRSYMFVSADGRYMGYVWTNFTHPSFLAKVMQKLNFSDMMLMDIHPAFGAGVAKPAVRGQPVADFFSRGGSYPLVPMESDVISGFASGIAQIARGGKRIQWNYKQAGSGTPNDFVGVFAK
jgi:hypothetical protein